MLALVAALVLGVVMLIVSATAHCTARAYSHANGRSSCAARSTERTFSGRRAFGSGVYGSGHC
jgi:uncharacterized membrane protein